MVTKSTQRQPGLLQSGQRFCYTEPVAQPAYPIDSVDKALRALKRLAANGALRVSELAADLDVARSTAHRLLAMLQHHGFVRQDAATRSYIAGAALIELARDVLGGVDIAAAARPHMERLQQLADGETVQLACLSGREVLYLACVESPKALRAGSRLGLMVPANCSATGKALLAALADDRVAELLGTEPLPSLTASSTTDRSALQAELREIRRSGYAVNIGGNEEGLSSVAAAIIDRSGHPHAAVAVGGPTSRLDDKRLHDLGPAVRAAAELIAKGLG